MENIKLSNFRKIKEIWDLDLAPITFFTGTNNSGKSTILKSLLLLEDHINSDNHFELDFNGENSRMHKIDCYDNAINRLNKAHNNKDLFFEYSNKGFDVRFWFQPSEDKTKGKLVKLEVERDDNAKLVIYNTGGLNYQLEFDDTLIERRVESKDDEVKCKDMALVQTIKNLLDEDEKLLVKLEKKLTERENGLIVLKSTYLDNIVSDSRRKINIDEFVGVTRGSTILALEALQLKAKVNPTRIIDELTSNFLNEEFGLDLSEKTYSVSFLDVNLFLIEKEIKNNKQKIISLKQEITESKKKLRIANKKLEENTPTEKSVITYRPSFSLEDFHPAERTIDRIVRRVLPRYLRDNDKSIKLAGIGSGSAQAFRLGERIHSALYFSVDHLSPHRNNQTRLYINNNTSTDINELIKEYSNHPINKKSGAHKFLKDWMPEFNIGDNYDIKSIDGVASKILVLEDKEWVNMVDKGFGAGQIFGILLKIALSIDNTKKNSSFRYSNNREQLIVIEEPEANLHPALQSKLAELFLEAFQKYNIKFIIETHSEYTLRQSQIHVKNLIEDNICNLKNIPFAVYYFDKDNGPYKMKYRKDGKFANEFGPGFFDVSSNLAFDIL